MEKKVFYWVDVFAEEKYAGNPLAIVRNARGLSDFVMQQIAREINFSETTFVLSDEKSGRGYEVRIFTPQEEIPFAGHPTLGTAFIIQQEIIGKHVEEVVLNLKAGEIPVSFSYKGKEPDILWMKQLSPVFGKTLTAERLARILNIAPEEINREFPIQEVSTGLPFIIVPLKTLETARRIRIDRKGYFSLVEKTEAKSILVFCPETYSERNDLNVRVFADYYGVPEDPATGSANGCLAGYLVKQRFLGEADIDLRVEQGYEIGRPSLLLLRAKERGKDIDVFVGGKVIMNAKGELV